MHPEPLVGAENASEAQVFVEKRAQKPPGSKKVPTKLKKCLFVCCFSPGRRMMEDRRSKMAEGRRKMDDGRSKKEEAEGRRMKEEWIVVSGFSSQQQTISWLSF
jgi:hypothetical protein